MNAPRLDLDDPAAVPRDDRAEGRVLSWLFDLGQNDTELPPLVRREHFWPGSPYRALFDTFAALRAAGQPCEAADVAAALEREGKKLLARDAIALLGEFGTITAANARQALDALESARQRRARLADLTRERSDLCNLAVPVADTLAATIAAVEQIRGDAGGTVAECRTLAELLPPKLGDADELLRRRFLCRGGGLLLVGPTGIGKSSFTMQALVLWALGRECFGIVPARPLRSLLIQAENDDGDLAEMRDGVTRGLHLSPVDQARAGVAILVRQEDARTGREFFVRTVEPLLVQHRPDLLVIDPALAFLGGESNSQADVGGFLRNGLNPLLHRYGCGGIVVHHTNKPPTGQEKGEWAGGDFAYLGGGSAEWANWSRAVLAIRSKGSHEVFELVLAKRGARVGWIDPGTGGKAFVKLIGHATEPGAICWREVDPSEVELANRSGKRLPQPDDLLSFIPELDPVEIDALLGKVQATGAMGKHKARDFLAVLKGAGRVFEWRVARPGVRPIVAYARRRQPAFDQLSRVGTTPGNNGNSGGKRVIPSTPIPPEGGVCGNNATPRRNNPGREEAAGAGVESEVGK